MGGVINAGIRVDWLDLLIWRIHEERECQQLVQKVNMFRTQGKKAEAYSNQPKNHLKQVEKTLAQKNLNSASMANYTIKVFQSPLHLDVFFACLCLSFVIFFLEM